MINIIRRYYQYYLRRNIIKRLKYCGTNVSLRFPLIIENMEGVSFGNNVSLASFVHIWGSGGLYVGDNTMIASHVAITTVDHDYNRKDMFRTVSEKGVYIGNNVWIGSHAIILPGVRINDGAVIGAGTLVNQDVPADAIFYGVPGRVVKYRKYE